MHNLFSPERQVYMAISYEKMLKLFKDRKITSYTFRKNNVISQGTWMNIKKGKGIDSSTLNSLCQYLGCQPGDLMEYIPDKEFNARKNQSEKKEPMDLREIKIASTYYYKGKIINMKVDDVRLPNGTLARREEVEHPGGCCIAALTQDNELFFVRQFRYAYDETILELPAGKLEPGEDPYEAMQRELSEETGCTADKFVFLGNAYPTPGYTNEILRIWACRVTEQGKMHLDEDEFLEVSRIPLQEAVDMVMRGELPDCKTQIGVLKTARLVEEGVL